MMVVLGGGNVLGKGGAALGRHVCVWRGGRFVEKDWEEAPLSAVEHVVQLCVPQLCEYGGLVADVWWLP